MFQACLTSGQHSILWPWLTASVCPSFNNHIYPFTALHCFVISLKALDGYSIYISFTDLDLSQSSTLPGGLKLTTQCSMSPHCTAYFLSVLKVKCPINPELTRVWESESWASVSLRKRGVKLSWTGPNRTMLKVISGKKCSVLTMTE